MFEFLFSRNVVDTSTLTLSQLCGRSIPGSLHSSGPQLSFKLHTSRGYNGGYDLTYTTTTHGPGCGGEVGQQSMES